LHDVIDVEQYAVPGNSGGVNGKATLPVVESRPGNP
jgi:hypothetical protein